MTRRNGSGYPTTIHLRFLDHADAAWDLEATIVDDVRARGGELDVKLCLGVILEPADAARLLADAGGSKDIFVKAPTPLGVVQGVLDWVEVLGAVGDAKHPSVTGAVIELVGVTITNDATES